jgi:hypothetical protein
MKLPSLTRGDMAILLSTLLLLIALAAPALRARGFERLTVRVAADVEVLVTAARDYHSERGTWPSGASPGVAPAELSGLFPGDSALVFDAYVLEWSQLESVRYEDVPRPTPIEVSPGDAPPDSAARDRRPVAHTLGAVLVRTEHEALLAELMARYGRDASFLRDSTWILILDDRTPDPVP